MQRLRWRSRCTGRMGVLVRMIDTIERVGEVQVGVLDTWLTIWGIGVVDIILSVFYLQDKLVYTGMVFKTRNKVKQGFGLFHFVVFTLSGH